MTLEEIKAEIEERLKQINAKRDEQGSRVEIPDYLAGLFDGVANGFYQVLGLLDTLKPSWHPFPDKKPTEDSLVLVQFDDGHMETQHFIYGDFLWDGNCVRIPIAWIELPKQYKKEDE